MAKTEPQTTNEPSPIQKECEAVTQRILTTIATQLATDKARPVNSILDTAVREAYADGVFAALRVLQSGYTIVHVQDMLAKVYNDVRDRTVVHAVAVLGTVPGTAAGAGAVHSSLPTRDDVLFGARGMARYGVGGGSREELIRVARNVARDSHGDQVEKDGSHYFGHLERVATLVREHASTVIAAAYLHDVLEDTTTNMDMLTAFGFPGTVLRAVDTLTRRSDNLKADGHDETYDDYIERIATSGDNIAIVVKHADLVDHLRGDNCPPELVPRYVKALKRIAPLATKLYAGLPSGAPREHQMYWPDERESRR